MRDMRLDKRTILTEPFPKLGSTAPAATPLRLIIIIIIVSIANYFSALFHACVFDDVSQVLEKQGIRDIRNITAIFPQSLWGFNSKASVLHYYRPLMHLFYTFNYYLLKIEAWIMITTNRITNEYAHIPLLVLTGESTAYQ
jgi:hypothetical protein